MLKRLPRRPLSRACFIAVCWVACAPPAQPTATPPPTITAQRAKQLAVDHFNETLAGRYHMKDPRTGSCSALPAIGLEHIDSAKLEGDSWLVERTPLIGLIFSIRVAKNGTWAAFEKVDAAVE